MVRARFRDAPVIHFLPDAISHGSLVVRQSDPKFRSDFPPFLLPVCFQRPINLLSGIRSNFANRITQMQSRDAPPER